MVTFFRPEIKVTHIATAECVILNYKELKAINEKVKELGWEE